MSTFSLATTNNNNTDLGLTIDANGNVVKKAASDNSKVILPNADLNSTSKQIQNSSTNNGFDMKYYPGWSETEARADWVATGGSKGNSGGSTTTETGSHLPQSPLETFNWDEAKTTALKELAPYYEKLLSMYKGDIALAKQHMDQDYERGLRVQTEKTTNGLNDIAATKVERDRKFAIAMGDLDQTMNTRGIATSGIRTTETNKATSDEAYQKGLLANQERDLNSGLKYYTEDINATRDQQLEKWGMKPVGTTVDGVYAPSNTGLNTTGYDVKNYTNEPLQKVAALDYQKEADAQTKVNNAFNQAVTNWQLQVQQLA